MYSEEELGEGVTDFVSKNIFTNYASGLERRQKGSVEFTISILFSFLLIIFFPDLCIHATAKRSRVILAHILESPGRDKAIDEGGWGPVGNG